jgi:hypothetical protein
MMTVAASGRLLRRGGPLDPATFLAMADGDVLRAASVRGET